MNIKHYFIIKTMKKYSRLSSAAVVTGALRVKQMVLGYPNLISDPGSILRRKPENNSIL